MTVVCVSFLLYWEVLNYEPDGLTVTAAMRSSSRIAVLSHEMPPLRIKLKRESQINKTCSSFTGVGVTEWFSVTAITGLQRAKSMSQPHESQASEEHC